MSGISIALHFCLYIDVLRAHASWRLETGNAPSGAKMPDFSTVIFPETLAAVAPDRVKLPAPATASAK